MFLIIKKIILISSCYCLSFGVGINSATSQAVCNISIDVARGDVGGGATITVWSGYGLNLDFSPTGEIIRKVWLDDPSRVIVDFDGNISGGAKIIHLRRITPVNIPELPSTSATLLTIVTAGRGDNTNLYSFRVDYGEGNPEYTTVRINNAPTVVALPYSPTPYSPPQNPPQETLPIPLSKTDKSPIIFTLAQNNLNSEDISRGLSRQCWNGLIPLSSWDYGKAKYFLTFLHRGLPADDAVQQSGVSVEQIIRLSRIGIACQSSS
ncbi:MAG: hypothetical protein SWX82_30470 [Cyanobacteriota bacterium]|nr:hypothetical protein [Cyanobacteriota bacterium]